MNKAAPYLLLIQNHICVIMVMKKAGFPAVSVPVNTQNNT